MRTNEERTELIHRRTLEIKQEQKRKRQKVVETVSVAACMVLICAMGLWMPDLIGRSVQDSGVYHTGAASMIGSHGQLGYILMGILSFLLGVCVTVLLYPLHSRGIEKHREDQDDEF